VYKGAPQLKLADLPQTTVAAAIVGTAAVVAALSLIFWMPFVYCRVVRHDYTVRWYHFFMGPLLWKRQSVAFLEGALADPSTGRPPMPAS
jgi:sodium-dependent phosphate transporter